MRYSSIRPYCVSVARLPLQFVDFRFCICHYTHILFHFQLFWRKLLQFFAPYIIMPVYFPAIDSFEESI